MSEHGLLSRSGGLVYHLRAQQYRAKLWQPFCAAVAQWLASWQPPTQQLLIVGPSGGYSLPASFLMRFDEVIAIEPDPVARWMLTRRFHRIAFRFETLDCFASAEGPAQLASAFPQASILFSNIVGQLLPSAPAGWREAVLSALRGHHWASYHDVISTGVQPRRAELFVAHAGDSLEHVLEQFWAGGELALTDHETFALTGQAGEYMNWMLTPSRHHLIEWQVHRPALENCA